LRDFRQALMEKVALISQALPQQDAPSADAPRKLRLLAAEDNKTNQMIFRKMIKALDLELELANNGCEAWEAYQAERPDLLFTDISMPEMDGLELTRRIRADEAVKGLPRLPIVAMTAHAMEDHEAEIVAAGVDHYLTKPLKKAEIIGKLNALKPEGVSPLMQE
jgi:CheY-like chemotaxis protein